MSEQGQETEPSIYLGADGAYHDDTPENREAYPAAEDQPEQADAEQGTVVETGSAPDNPMSAEPVTETAPEPKATDK